MAYKLSKSPYSPLRTGLYMATARFGVVPVYFVYNRFTVTGQANIPGTPVVAVGNHLSYWDPPLMSVAIDRPIAFLAKKELYNPGLMQFFLTLYGTIPVDRQKPELSTFKTAKKALEAGWSLGMFIEGTRSKTPGVLSQPQLGAAYFAKTYAIPLLPMGIIGTNKPWGKVYVHIGKPIEPSPDLSETTWKVMEALSQLTGFSLPSKDD